MDILKDGSKTYDRRLDLIFDPAPKPNKHLLAADNRELKSVLRDCGKFLDQGTEGACVGFGITHSLLSMFPGDGSLDAEFAREDIYWEAQKEDPWPGGSYPGADPVYEGTTVNAGLKEALELNYLESFKWADNTRAILIGLQDGPVVLGLKWYSGMYKPDLSGYIKPTGGQIGGHCIYLEGLDIDNSRVILHNSWGADWGVGGRCYMSLDDFDTIFSDGGEGAVLFPGNPQEEKQYPWWKVLFLKWFGEA